MRRSIAPSSWAVSAPHPSSTRNICRAELGNMPSLANAGIVLAGLQNGELTHALNRDLPFAPPMGIVNGHI
jgi:hypothetical protein